MIKNEIGINNNTKLRRKLACLNMTGWSDCLTGLSENDWLVTRRHCILVSWCLPLTRVPDFEIRSYPVFKMGLDPDPFYGMRSDPVEF